MADRDNWERERMRDRGHEGNREHGRGRDQRRRNDRGREPRYYGAEERNRPWEHEGRFDRGGEEPNRGWNRWEGQGDYRRQYDENRSYGGGESRWNEGGSSGPEYQSYRGYEGRGGSEGWRGNEGRGNEEWREQDGPRANESWQRGSQGGRGYAGEHRGYGPGEFTRQFRGGPEYFGAGQRGYGTTWGAAGYTGFGGSSGYTGGLGTYAEQGSYAGRGPKGYQRSDDRIREDICERLTNHPEIDASEIEIQVNKGEVTLTGAVDRREDKRMAEDLAESVSGVKDVHNQLRAQPQGALAGQTGQGAHANRESPNTRTK